MGTFFERLKYQMEISAECAAKRAAERMEEQRQAAELKTQVQDLQPGVRQKVALVRAMRQDADCSEW